MDKWPELGWSNEVTASWVRGPNEYNSKLLDRALEMVQSVSYRVTLRWMFYGLWQEGWYRHVKPTKRANAKQRAYETFASLMSRLRHSDDFYWQWPIELADDRRDPVYRSQGFADVDEWLEHQKKKLACNVDKMSTQDYYVIVAFEAEAMLGQFEHLTQNYHVDLWPFSGKTSIHYKQRLAKSIDWAADKFDLPVIVLYFGDYDETGLEIPESAFRHIRKWAESEFTAYRVGLNKEHISKYEMTDDPDEPGKYQWEALRDEGAREIVTGALDALLCQDTINELIERERSVTRMVREALGGIELDS